MRLTQVSTLLGNVLGYTFINKKKIITITDAPNNIFNKYLSEYPAIKDIIKTVEKRITAVDKFEGKIKQTIIITGNQKRNNELLKVGFS